MMMFQILFLSVASAHGYSDDLAFVDLINPNYLSVFKNSAGNIRLLEDGRNFVNNTVRTECSAGMCNNTAAYPNSTLSWQINTSEKLDFEYGSLDLQVKLPENGVSSVNIGLYSTLFPQADCSQVKKMSTGVSFYLTTANRKTFDIFTFYPDRQSNMSSQLYTEGGTFNVSQPRKDQNGFQLIQLFWSESFVSWKVDDVVVNFTNQLSLPVGKHILNIDITCARETVHQPSQEAAFVTAKAEYRKLPHSEKCNSDIQVKMAPPDTLTDYWSAQEAVVYLHSYNDEVAVYFDRIRKTPTGESGIYSIEDVWVYRYIRDVWAYLNQQYGPLLQRGESVLYAVFREGKSKRCYTSLQRTNSSDLRTTLLCDSNDPTAWSWNKRNLLAKMDIGHVLSYFVVRCSQGIQGNQNLPSVNEALQDIVAYDLFVALNQTIQAKQLFDQRSSLTSSFPSNESYWRREWFFPLYRKYDGARVLSRYFEVLARNFPTATNDNGIRRYKRNISNLGEYVHFWSGAANESLKNSTKNAFGWSTQDDKDLRRAQKEFPNVRYPRQMDIEFDTLLLNDALENVKLLVGILVPALFLLAFLATAVFLYQRRNKRLDSTLEQTR